MATEPPPAYSEPAGGSGDAPPETKPKQAKQPDEPAPDGDGPLGPPMKRMMYIGAILLLYYILAFWMPVYWMRAASAYCEFRCTNYYEIGCYETTDAACEDTCLAACEVCDDLGDACTDLMDAGYESAYVNTGRPARLASFTLIVLGIALGSVGCILGYFAVKKGNQLQSKIATVLLGLSGSMTIIGAIIFLATWHDTIDFEEVLAATQLLVLVEWLLPAIFALELAQDIFQPFKFNDERTRMLAMTIPLAVCALLGGFLMAYIINFEPEYAIGWDFPLYDQGGCIAAGYFMIGLLSVARIAIWGEYVKVSDNPASVISAKFAVAVLYVISGFILACGYWSWIAGLFDCDYNILTGTTVCEGAYMITLINADTLGPSWVNEPGVPYESQFKCYYVAYSFFMLGISVILAFDMGIVESYKAVRMAQQAAS